MCKACRPCRYAVTSFGHFSASNSYSSSRAERFECSKPARQKWTGAPFFFSRTLLLVGYVVRSSLRVVEEIRVPSLTLTRLVFSSSPLSFPPSLEVPAAGRKSYQANAPKAHLLRTAESYRGRIPVIQAMSAPEALLAKVTAALAEEHPNHLTLPDTKAVLAPFPPSCPVLVYSPEGTDGAGGVGGAYLAKVESVYIDLGSVIRDNYYRVRTQHQHQNASGSGSSQRLLQSVPESALRYAPGCTVSVSAASLPPFLSENSAFQPGVTRDATIISCCDIPTQDESNTTTAYYLIDVSPGPNDTWSNIQSTVPSSALHYRPTATDNTVQENEREAAAAADAAARREDAPSPVVPAAPPDNVDGGVVDARAVSLRPHKIPVDEDASLNSAAQAGRASPVTPAASSKSNLPAAAAGAAAAEDDGSSTRSPVPAAGHKRSRSGPTEDAPKEEVVRRIDIPNTLDMKKVKDVLVGPNYKINHKMQTKFAVSIFILGLDDILEAPPSGSSNPIELLGKLGHHSPKPGDKCVVIRGSERKVYDASKVVIHLLVEKCYVGDDKDSLKRKLRVVRQVRRKAPSPTKLGRAASDSVATVSTSAEESPAKKPAIPATVVKALAEAAARRSRDPPTKKLVTSTTAAAVKVPTVQRGWSPALPETDDDNSTAGAVETAKAHAVQRGWSPALPETDDDNSTAGAVETAKAHAVQRGWSPALPETGDDNSTARAVETAKAHAVQRGWSPALPKTDDDNSTAGAVSHDEKKYIAREHEMGRNPSASAHGNYRDDGSLRPSERGHLARDSSDDHTRGCRSSSAMCLVMADPNFDGNEWIVRVHSPVDYFTLYHTVIGEGNIKKKELLAKFGSILVAVRGSGARKAHRTNDPNEAGMPLHVYIKGPNRSVIESAAEYIAHMLLKSQEQGCAAVTNDVPMGEPYWNGGKWAMNVRPPTCIDENFLFKVVVGRGAQRKKHLVAQFGGTCYITVQGKGIGGKEGPLRVLIVDPDKAVVEAAASHVTKLLHEAASNHMRFEPNQQHNTAGWRHHEAPHAPRERQHWGGNSANGPMRLIMADPFFDGSDWILNVKTPLSESRTFGLVIGERCLTQKELVRRFDLRSIQLRGTGIRERDCRSMDGPLHVRIAGNDRSSIEHAAEYIARTLLDEYDRERSMHSDCRHHDAKYGCRQADPHFYRRPAPAAPVAPDLWATTVWAPVDDTHKFFGCLVGRGGDIQREIEGRFNVQVSAWGKGVQQSRSNGNHPLLIGSPNDPLHTIISGRSRRGVDDAAQHIANLWKTACLG